MINIKEFFNIEPIQKNGLLILLFTFLVSYLQLFLFKSNFEKLELFDKIILSTSVSVFWIVSELPTYFFFINSKLQKWKQNGKVFNVDTERVVAAFGFTLILWMVLLCCIGYEMNMDLKTFIRISFTWMLVKNIYWFIYFLKYTYKDNKRK